MVKWNLSDLVNFESLLKTAEIRAEHRLAVSNSIRNSAPKGESEKRKLGLKVWFDFIITEKEASPDAGERLTFSLRLLQSLFFIISTLLGVSLMAGLIERVGVTEGQAYNVWKLLAIPLGIQWLFIILSLISWGVLRKSSRKFTFFEEVIGQIVKRLSGKSAEQSWNELYRAGSAYRTVLSWRIARMTQWAAIGFNIGIIGGFYGILLFLEINFFWASTIKNFGLPQLENLTQVISLPWSSWAPAWKPTSEQLSLTQLQIGELNADGAPEFWYPFLLCSFIAWGLLPRITLTAFCLTMERRGIAKLTFMEKRHRELWRNLSTSSQRDLNLAEPEDSTILIDFGGISIPDSQIRPFLLQQLRLNPTEHFTAGILKADEKEQALNAIKASKRGTVVLVESWNLSPKQLQNFHQELRNICATSTIHYIVLGLQVNSLFTAPPHEEFEEWKSFIVSLADPETEIIKYQPVITTKTA